MVKKKRQKNKKQSKVKAISRAKLALVKSLDQSYTFSNIRKDIPSGYIDDFTEWVFRSSRLKKNVLGHKFPMLAQDLGVVYVPMSIKKSSEMRWACSIIKRHAAELNDFVSLSVKYERYFLLGKYEQGDDVLEKIKEKYGYSIWLIKKELIHLQFSKGLEAQKKYAKEILDGDYKVGRIPFITHYISHRTETSISPSRFVKYVNEHLEQLDIGVGLRAYLKFQILNEPISSSLDINNIIRYEFNGSIIDQYETFLSMIRLALSSNEISLADEAGLYVAELSELMGDSRLTALLNNSNKTSNKPLEQNIENINNLLEGKSSEVYASAISELAINPSNIGAVYLATLSVNQELLDEVLKENNQTPTYLLPLLEIFVNRTLGDQWMLLKQIAWALEGSVVSLFLNAMICREYSSYPLARHSVRLFYYFPYSVDADPIFLFWFDEESERKSYCDLLRSRDTNESRNCIIEISDLLEKGLCTHDIHRWTVVKDKIYNKNYADAENESSNLESSKSYYYIRNAFKAKLYCLFKLKHYSQCIDNIITNYVSEGAHIQTLPIREVYESLERGDKEKLSSEIDYVILTSLYVFYFEPNLQYLLSDSCEDFLTANKINRPSQVHKLSTLIDQEKLIYFLKEICIEQTMDTWMEFTSSQEVALERVEVCRLIINLDSSEKEVCQADIREIMQRLAIKERLREIDQSKIYVDIESVRKVAKSNLKENFTRYTSFLSSGMSPEDIEVREVAAQVLANEDMDEILSLKFPRHEMSAIFESMVIHLRDEFVSSNQHGLDGYLSVRIRHNTLAGQLWNPFESEHLLVFKDSLGKKYKPNDYWIEELGIKNLPEDCLILEESLIHFNKEFEQLVDKLRNEWIKVKVTNDDFGLIDFRLLDKEVAYLSTYVSKDTSLDSFIDDITKYFFTSKLEPGLKVIRSQIQFTIKPQVHDVLTNLQSSLESISTDSSRFRTAIGRARTNAQITLDRITEWFRLSSIEKQEIFSIEEVINISDASIKTACAEFVSNYYPSDEIVNFVIKGNLTSFVDILFIAFDNIVHHSGPSGYPIANIYAEYSNKMVKVRIENEVALSVSKISAQKQHVEQMREQVIRKPFSPSVNREGGTGFYKMQKILHHDFSLLKENKKPILDFGFHENNLFFVQICIPISYVEKLEDSV